jgi:HK97 gp10 family phage protein
MPLAISVKVHGVRETIANFKRLSAELRRELQKTVARSAMSVQRGARRRCPVDTGRLRASIRPVYYRDGLSAEVGTEVSYAAFMEFGTGSLGASTNEQPLPSGYQHGGPFKPPAQALVEWARRHKVSPWAVSLGIFQAGGVAARPFLFPAWEEERPRFIEAVKRQVPKAAKKVAVTAK